MSEWRSASIEVGTPPTVHSDLPICETRWFERESQVHRCPCCYRGPKRETGSWQPMRLSGQQGGRSTRASPVLVRAGRRCWRLDFRCSVAAAGRVAPQETSVDCQSGHSSYWGSVLFRPLIGMSEASLSMEGSVPETHFLVLLPRTASSTHVLPVASQ